MCLLRGDNLLSLLVLLLAVVTRNTALRENPGTGDMANISTRHQPAKAADSSAVAFKAVLNPDISTVTREFLSVAYSITLLTSIAGNALVLHTINRNMSLRNTTDILIANTACADILTCFVFIPSRIKHVNIGAVWLAGTFGSVLCKGLRYTEVVTVNASIFTLVTICVERFLAVCLPLRLLSTATNHARKLIVTIWIASALLPIQTLTAYTVDKLDNSKKHYCYFSWSVVDRKATRVNMIIQFSVTYAIPLTTMVVLYVLIFIRLRIRQVGTQLGNARRDVAHRTTRKVTAMMAAVVCIFAVCWLPWLAMLVVRALRPDVLNSLPFDVYVISVWLSSVNGALNPCVYGVFNEKYRRAFKKTLGLQTDVTSVIDYRIRPN